MSAEKTSRDPRSPRRPRICIVAHNAYGALIGGRTGHVGGAEYQTTFLARWLAAHGHDVSLVTWDEGQGDGVVVDGVRVVKMCREDAGLPGLRFFSPRLRSFLAAIRRADADVYYHNSAEYVTGVLASWCRARGRKLVYSVASDVACDIRLPAMRKGYERVLYRHGVRRAHRLIVQSQRQQEMLRAGFGVESVVLPMPCPGPSDEEFRSVPAPALNSVAWVGRADHMKRLDWVLEIAARLPHVRFELAVANLARSANGQALHARAARLPNVNWRWNVPRPEMPDVYRNTACLCCTSVYEGFPNTFLEAWSHGRPVVTSFDPDGIVARRNVGAVANSVDEFVRKLGTLCTNHAEWSTRSRNARAYYVERHTPAGVMPMIEHELESAWNPEGRTGAPARGPAGANGGRELAQAGKA